MYEVNSLRTVHKNLKMKIPMSLLAQSKMKIEVYNVVLNYIQNHNWINYDNFTNELLSQFQKGNFDLDKILDNTKGSFLKLNNTTKYQFINDTFRNSILRSWNKALEYYTPVFRFSDIFSEILILSDEKAEKLSSKIVDVPEQKIQTALREALREKNASPIARRGKDSALEVADLEHFEMKISGKDFSFSIVVKGYRSISGKLNLESIMHQLHKAYRTHPDYIILISARDPVDGVVTEMNSYSRDVGNPNLIIFVPPLDLVKFLVWRNII